MLGISFYSSQSASSLLFCRCIKSTSWYSLFHLRMIHRNTPMSSILSIQITIERIRSQGNKVSWSFRNYESRNKQIIWSNSLLTCKQLMGEFSKKITEKVIEQEFISHFQTNKHLTIKVFNATYHSYWISLSFLSIFFMTTSHQQKAN